MGSAYSSIPTTDDNEAFAARAITEIRLSRRCKSAAQRRGSQLRQALHSESVNALAVVRPGVLISADRAIIAHNTDTGDCIYKWTRHDHDEVTKVIYKHVNSSHLVLTGSRDASVHMWRFNVPHPLQIFRGHTLSISGLELVDEARFVSGGRDARLTLWDIETAKALRVVATNRNLVTHIEKAPHEHLIAQTSEDRTLRLWDSRSLELVFQSPPRHHILTHCTLAGDEPLVLTSSGGNANEGCELTLWDLRSRQVVREYRAHEAAVRSALFVPPTLTTKRCLLSCSNDHTVRIWHQEDSQCLWTECIPTTGNLNACVGFADGTIVVSGDNALLCGFNLHNKAGRPLLVANFTQSLAHNSYELSATAAAGRGQRDAV